MSWSLQITHGDFNVSNASLSTVNSTPKLVQDFRCYLLEQMGIDNMHPDYGSLIDGGVKPDGTVVPSIIGEIDFRKAFDFIESEIRRIAQEYQERQLARARADKFTYGKVTLDPGEILLGVSSVNAQQTTDTMDVVVTLTAATNVEAILAIPIPNTLIVA